MRGSTIEVKCENKSCGVMFTARVADRKRGWGKFCSKSCKAIKQERRTGQMASYLQGINKPKVDQNGVDENWDEDDSTYWNGKDYD